MRWLSCIKFGFIRWAGLLMGSGCAKKEEVEKSKNGSPERFRGAFSWLFRGEEVPVDAGIAAGDQAGAHALFVEGGRAHAADDGVDIAQIAPWK